MLKKGMHHIIVVTLKRGSVIKTLMLQRGSISKDIVIAVELDHIKCQWAPTETATEAKTCKVTDTAVEVATKAIDNMDAILEDIQSLDNQDVIIVDSKDMQVLLDIITTSIIY